jgi:hypothetical protein
MHGVTMKIHGIHLLKQSCNTLVPVIMLGSIIGNISLLLNSLLNFVGVYLHPCMFKMYIQFSGKYDGPVITEGGITYSVLQCTCSGWVNFLSLGSRLLCIYKPSILFVF